MIKQEAFGNKINLHKYFEASLNALQEAENQNRVSLSARARALGSATGEILSKRAVADAASALAVLWKLKTSPKTR